MSKEIATTVAIDHKAAAYFEYMLKRRAVEQLAKEMQKLEAELREAVGDHEAATIFGDVVITNRPTKTFKAKALEADNPTLFKEFTRPVLVDKFDPVAFQATHPNLYEQYRSRQFIFKEAK